MMIVDWLLGSKCDECRQRTRTVKREDPASGAERRLCDRCHTKLMALYGTDALCRLRLAEMRKESARASVPAAPEGGVRREPEVVAAMPAAEATQLAKMTAQASGIAVTELDISGLMLGAKVGRREHITLSGDGKPVVTAEGRAVLADLTVWIDNQSLYVVRGNVFPSPTARYLGVPPEGFFAQSVKKYRYPK